MNFRSTAATRRRNKGEQLGHKVRLDSLEHLRSDLEALAVAPYQNLLEVQRNLTCPTALSMPDLIEGFGGAGPPKKVRPIVEAFAAGTKFFNPGQRYSRELRRLSDRGWVRHLGRGFWAAEPEVSRAFQLLAYRDRHIGAAR